MGSSQSNPEAKWKGSMSGYRYVTNNITSNSSVKKVSYADGSQVWGPYKKKYITSSFGQPLFTAPGKVDGVRILCRCRDIHGFMREASSSNLLVGSAGTLAFGSNRPACWEDSENPMNPGGGDTFNVTIGHLAFYSFAASNKGVLGLFGGRRKTRKNKRKSKGKK